MICRENRKPLCKNRSKNNIESRISKAIQKTTLVSPSATFLSRETLDDLNERAEGRVESRARDPRDPSICEAIERSIDLPPWRGHKNIHI